MQEDVSGYSCNYPFPTGPAGDCPFSGTCGEEDGNSKWITIYAT
jgi:hypothetical protein